MFSDLDSIISLGCSIVAFCSTIYFWFIRNHRERAQLDVEVTNRLDGRVVLVHEDQYPYHTLVEVDGHDWGCYPLDLVIANQSVLPNSIVRLRVQVMLSSGVWVQTHCRVDGEATLPVNLDPLTTRRLSLALYLPVQGGAANRAERISSANSLLHHSRCVRVQVVGMSGKQFDFDCDAVGDVADPLVRSATPVRVAA